MTMKVIVSLMLVALQFTQSIDISAKGPKFSDQGPWNYDYSQSSTSCGACSNTNKCGPACWSKIVPADKTIKNQCGGKMQTPINIVQARGDVLLTPPTYFTIAGGCKNWAQFADDHAFEVSFSDVENVCANQQLRYCIDGECNNYTAKQFHFHSKSEHTIGGGYDDAELHVVHKTADGKKALVLGVLISPTLSDTPDMGNTFLRNFWDVANSGKSTNKFGDEYEVKNAKPISVYNQFLPASSSYFTYEGSLTTYPCSEGIRWIVFEDSIKVSKADLQLLRSAVAKVPGTIIDPVTKNDNRPIQPLGVREVRKYLGFTAAASPVKHLR